MKAVLFIQCYQCDKCLARILVDTADMPDELQSKINQVILNHRANCDYGGPTKEQIEKEQIEVENGINTRRLC